jgi:cytochrome c oxidase assembly protein subunit 15
MDAASWWSNPINVHFVHRGLAYIILLLVVIATVQLYKRGLRGWLCFAALASVCTQVVLGVMSVLTSPRAERNAMGVFEWHALLHQFVALLLLMSLVAWWQAKSAKSA